MDTTDIPGMVYTASDTADAVSNIDTSSIGSTIAGVVNAAQVYQNDTTPIAPAPTAAPVASSSFLSNMSTAEKVMIVLAIGALALGAMHINLLSKK